jgi:two-component sensor histidine kinase
MTKVWLVPDDLESHASLEALLRRNGYDVEIVSVGAEASLHSQSASLEAVATDTSEQWHVEEQVFGSAGIDLQVDAADLSLSVDSAIPCGLIVTELVTNAIKHAFPGGLEQTDAGASAGLGASARLRQIRVSLFEKDSQYVLEVCDNGVGLPPDLDWRTTRSLGLRLVTRLAGQLHGSLDVDIQNGTRFRLTFPKPD